MSSRKPTAAESVGRDAISRVLVASHPLEVLMVVDRLVKGYGLESASLENEAGCGLRAFLILLGSLVLFALAAVAVAWFVLTQRVEGQYFESVGARLHYTDEGQGEVVLLLHGFAVNSDLNWRLTGIVGALSPRFRVVALDLRGHGLSDKPHGERAYGLALIADVINLLDHLRIERAHLVGYSLGGFVALKSAALYPERIRSTTLIGAGWEAPDGGLFLSAIPRLQETLVRGGSIGPLSEFLEGAREPPSLLHAWSVHLMTGYFNDPHALAALIGSLPELTVPESELRMIPGPVLAIVGERDPFRLSAAALCGRVQDYRMMVVEGADHVRLAWEATTTESLLQFLIGPERIADGCAGGP
ncbi:MAG: alpha/beta hydrolase [Chromatiales bacterium]|jgi:pimeloyl-ACP methyl ester carboxylesterase